MNRRSAFVGFLGLLAVHSPVMAQVPADWDKVYARFSEGYKKLDASMVSTLYAEDAFYLPPGSEVLRGRAAIHGTFDSFFKSVAQRGDSIRIGTFCSASRK